MAKPPRCVRCGRTIPHPMRIHPDCPAYIDPAPRSQRLLLQLLRILHGR